MRERPRSFFKRNRFMINEKQTVRSKQQVQAERKNKTIAVMINLLSILMGLTVVINFIFGNRDFTQLLTGGIVALMLAEFARKMTGHPHYEPCLADIWIENDSICLCYQEQGNGQTKTIRIPKEQLVSVEYSDQLQCFRFGFRNKIGGSSNGNSHLFYILDGQQERVEGIIQEVFQGAIQYMDRNP